MTSWVWVRDGQTKVDVVELLTISDEVAGATGNVRAALGDLMGISGLFSSLTEFGPQAAAMLMPFAQVRIEELAMQIQPLLTEATTQVSEAAVALAEFSKWLAHAALIYASAEADADNFRAACMNLSSSGCDAAGFTFTPITLATTIPHYLHQFARKDQMPPTAGLSAQFHLDEFSRGLGGEDKNPTATAAAKVARWWNDLGGFVAGRSSGVVVMAQDGSALWSSAGVFGMGLAVGLTTREAGFDEGGKAGAYQVSGPRTVSDPAVSNPFLNLANASQAVSKTPGFAVSSLSSSLSSPSASSSSSLLFYLAPPPITRTFRFPKAEPNFSLPGKPVGSTPVGSSLSGALTTLSQGAGPSPLQEQWSPKPPQVATPLAASSALARIQHSSGSPKVGQIQILKHEAPSSGLTGKATEGSGQAERSWTVILRGTQEWMPGSKNPQDMTSNLQAVGRTVSDQQISAVLAMDLAGIKPGEPVELVGHSQGGAVALSVAADKSLGEKYNVVSVLTAGAPTGTVTPPSKVAVLNLENLSDLVPALDGAATATSPNSVTAYFDSRNLPVSPEFNSHSVEVYMSAANALENDRTNSPMLTPMKDWSSKRLGALGLDERTRTEVMYFNTTRIR